jgi:hypothetical protein
MSWPILILVTFALVLAGLMLLASRAPKRRMLTVEKLQAVISEPRHLNRMPQISQALEIEDLEFLRGRGRIELAERVGRERKQIALNYVDRLEEDFENLLEASRFLATISPKAEAGKELERLKLGIRFHACSAYMRWSLRLGLEPWPALKALSEMASGVAHQLEEAVARVGELAALGATLDSLLDERGDRAR